MPKYFTAPIGTSDILPSEHDHFTFVKKVIRHRFRQAGFRRINTPTFEDTAAYERSLGSDSEIMARELYSFEDRQGRSFSLRPEMTTGVIRSFIENKMDEGPLPVELYYIAPCYRFERPNSRTQRQFWQIGAEVIGESDPSIDAQLIFLAHKILEDLEIRPFTTLKINTMGSVEDRQQFYEALENFYRGKERSLSEVTQERLKNKRYLDLLSPRNEDEEILLDMAPKLCDFLSPKSKAFFDQVIEYVESFGIEYEIDPKLVRPIGFYTNTIFEFHEESSTKKVLVGGRYDNLVEKMGGKPNGGVGFSAGFERITKMMKDHEIDVPHKDTIQIFLAATGPVAKKKALPLLVKLREHGFHAVGVLGKTSMQEQLTRAEKFNVPFTLLMGDIEVKKGQIIVRNMTTRKQEWIDVDDVIPHMDELLGVPKDFIKRNKEVLDTTIDFLGHE